MGGEETLLLVATPARTCSTARPRSTPTARARRDTAAFREPPRRVPAAGTRMTRRSAARRAGAAGLRGPQSRSTGSAARSPESGRPAATSGGAAATGSGADQRDESGRLCGGDHGDLGTRELGVTEYVGDWAHSKEFNVSARLPLAAGRARD